MALRQPKRRKANSCNVSVTVGLSLNIRNTIHIAFHFPTFYYIDSQLLCIEISNNVIGLVQNYWYVSAKQYLSDDQVKCDGLALPQ